MLEPFADITKAEEEKRSDDNGREIAADAVWSAEKGVIKPQGEVVGENDEDGEADIDKGFAEDEADVQEAVFDDGVCY